MVVLYQDRRTGASARRRTAFRRRCREDMSRRSLDESLCRRPDWMLHSMLTLIPPMPHNHLVEVVRLGRDMEARRHAVERKEAGSALRGTYRHGGGLVSGVVSGRQQACGEEQDVGSVAGACYWTLQQLR